MPPAVTTAGAITPGGVRDGDPAVLAALCARRGPAVLAFTRTLTEPYATRAAADAFARFRAAVVDSGGAPAVHPDALLLGCARRATLVLLPPGPELGCPGARELLSDRAERSISPGDDGKLQRHLEICPSCRGISARLASAERAYREADDEPLPPEVTAAIVAALAATAPVRLPDEAGNGIPRVTDLRAAGAPAAAGGGSAEEEPEPEPEPEPARFEHGSPAAAGGGSAEPEPEDLEPRLPYYQVPPPPTRSRRGERSRRAAQGAGAAVGVAASVARWAAGSARRKLVSPTPDAPTPDAPPAVAPPPPVVEEPARVEASQLADPEPRPLITIGDFSEPELEQPEVLPESPAIPSPRRRQRTPPPRLLRPRRHHRHHRPLRDHSPRELVMPASLLVAAAAIIMAVAGVFGGGSSRPATTTARIISTSAPVQAHPERSATAMSLATAEALTAGTAAPTTSP